MKILIVSHNLPSPFDPSLVRVFYFIKHLSRKHKHEIALFSLKEAREASKCVRKLEEYCNTIETFERLQLDYSFQMAMSWAKRSIFSYQNIFSEKYGFLSSTFSPKLRERISRFLRMEKVDISYCSDVPMAFYVSQIDLPKVIDPIDALVFELRQSIGWERSFLRKLLIFFHYHQRKRMEKKYGENGFDRWIVASCDDREKIMSYLPSLNISVVPNGVDTEYFQPVIREFEYPNLVFVGSMSGPSNVRAVVHFYRYIFPLIKQERPDVKLYVVGRRPSNEITKMASDESVIVTGEVKDIRPYIASASVMIAPMLPGKMGIMNKVLEGMAMGKPVVSTSAGVHAIEVSPGKNIILADDPKEYAMRVIELLNDKELRRRIGQNARRLVESKYSWERATDQLNGILEDVVRRSPRNNTHKCT